jgi:hypothetical protein
MKSLKVDEKVGSGFATRKINTEKSKNKNLNENFHLESETKRNEAKKLVLCFRLSMRKQSETDPVSLNFASKRKNILCETGAP